jgi:hypothetical protein
MATIVDRPVGKERPAHRTRSRRPRACHLDSFSGDITILGCPRGHFVVSLQVELIRRVVLEDGNDVPPR